MNEPSVVESILHIALGKAPGSDRDLYLDEACRSQPELRGEVDRLLAAHPQAIGFLETQSDKATAAFASAKEHPGNVVAGRYKLLESIGEGGMGEVWVADQLEPIRRRVALKLIKPGMDSRAVLARFEAERQALALMDHPNIAKVLDAGTTADHRPYFVMELVKGTPITEFCDARKLSPRERLELFIPVCQAIQHAHTKGIIHRDIKPSNVLVALHDDRPVAKVIDFGVSKAIGQQLTEKTLYTGFGALVGTPTYMAPEQATFNQLDIDTRADVYALGVLLYELLAGSPPVEPERVKKAALDEMLRLVREEEPPRPSQRLSTSQSKASIAAVRQSDPEKLSKLFRGELDWIVMKALEKDRNRRYETANGFAADVQRYLSGEQVQAVPPSAGYRLQKFAKKNRVMLTTAAAFVGLLLVAVGVSSWLAVRATQAEARMEQKRTEAELNAKAAANNANLYMNSVVTIAEARVDAVIESRYLQTDLDLMEAKTDPRLGLVRLAKSLNSSSNKSSTQLPNTAGGMITQTFELDTIPKYQRLREFITVAVLTNGQEFAPLLPPITHAGAAITKREISPDQSRLLTLGDDSTARLWDLRNARQIALLKESSEGVIHCGFNRDGSAIYTDDGQGCARFWNAGDGKFIAKTESQPDLYQAINNEQANQLISGNQQDPWQIKTIDARKCMILGKNRLITRRVAGKARDDSGKIKLTDQVFAGPVVLWDLATGKRLAQIDRFGIDIGSFKFLGDGRWISARDGTAAIIFSAADGKEVAKLEHSGDAGIKPEAMAVSPSGEWLETLTRENGIEEPAEYRLHFWDTSNWRKNPISTKARSAGEFLTDDYLRAAMMGDSFGGQPLFILKVGRAEPICEFNAYDCRVRIENESILVMASVFARTGNTKVDLLNGLTGARILPAAESSFHPDLAKFSQKGRFVLSPLADTLVDLRTNKSIYLEGTGDSIWTEDGNRGLVKIFPTPQRSIEVRIAPLDSALSQFPKMLELWTQVTVRGELDDQGEFVKWSEPEWEKKRQELASIPPPIKDFPFPGYVASDKLHWLRAEYKEATDETQKKRLAQELLRRSEENGDKAEAVRWMAIVTPLSEPAPATEPK